MAVFRINDRVYNCPLELTLSVIGGKWKILILIILARRTQRYSEIHAELPEISHKMLAQQLRELERDHLIERTVHPVVPPKVEYALSSEGRRIIPILSQMGEWGMRYYVEDSEPKGSD